MLVANTADGLRVAAVIAQLLNRHNRLQWQYDGSQILESEAVYFPAVHKGRVLGAVALRRTSRLLSEVKHLVVAPQIRGFGMGNLLVETALRAVQTPFVCAFVRTDNGGSLALFQKKNFTVAVTNQVGDHAVHLLLRVR